MHVCEAAKILEEQAAKHESSNMQSPMTMSIVGSDEKIGGFSKFPGACHSWSRVASILVPNSDLPSFSLHRSRRNARPGNVEFQGVKMQVLMLGCKILDSETVHVGIFLKKPSGAGVSNNFCQIIRSYQFFLFKYYYAEMLLLSMVIHTVQVLQDNK